MSLSFDLRYNFSHSNDQYWERISLLFHLISNYIPAQFKDIKSEEALFRFFHGQTEHELVLLHVLTCQKLPEAALMFTSLSWTVYLQKLKLYEDESLP
jgi:hypothetical protein